MSDILTCPHCGRHLIATVGLARAKWEGAHIDSLGLRTRTRNPLVRAGVHTIEHAASLTEEELLHIRNFGKRGAAELKAALERWKEAPA